MLTRTNIKNKDELSILGFGCMRFPTKGTGIDETRAIAMIRDSIEKALIILIQHIFIMPEKANLFWEMHYPVVIEKE